MSILKKRFKTDTLLLTIMIIYLFLCISSAAYLLLSNQIRNGILSLIFTLFVPIMFWFEKILKIKLNPLFTLVLLLLSFGGILGTCYDFYTIFPFFDNILHVIAGFIFTYLGTALMYRFLKRNIIKQIFLPYLLFGIMFSLGVAVIWEIFEYLTTFLGFDMLEDTIIHSFNSYLLAGTHSEIVVINDITKTVIFYGNGQNLVINGYLDIGLLDTLQDMIVCIIGIIIYVVSIVIGYYKIPKLYKQLILDN